MKPVVSVSMSWLLSVVAVLAGVPEDPTMTQYRKMLGDKSPFVIKKVAEPVVSAPVNTALSLKGVSKFKDGWIVTLVDKKQPNKSIILREGKADAKSGIRLLKVNQRKGDFAATTVNVLTGGRQVTVTYNLPAIKRGYSKQAAAVKPVRKPVNRTQQQPSGNGLPPGILSNSSATSTKKSSSGRRPRVRRSSAKAK